MPTKTTKEPKTQAQAQTDTNGKPNNPEVKETKKPVKKAPKVVAEVKYPKNYAVIYRRPGTPGYDPDNHQPPLTCQQAKEIMGWEVESEENGNVFGTDFLLKDLDGNKVRCTNNVGNRFLDPVKVSEVKQDILTGEWQYNGEAGLVTMEGHTPNLQHRLVGFILACQEWEKAENGPGKNRFKSVWPEMPTLDITINYGVPGDDKTIATMDQTKARTVADVFYTAGMFVLNPDGVHYTPSERNQLTKGLDYGVKLLWSRTGMGQDAYSPRRTHSEALQFVESHRTLRDCVEHLWSEDVATKGGVRGLGLAPGTCAGMMYLMITSGTPQDQCEKYRKSASKKEKNLTIDPEVRALAEDFWSAVVNLKDKRGQTVRDKLDLLNDREEAGVSHAGGTFREKIAVIAKAWEKWGKKGGVKEEHLDLSYVTIEERMMLDEQPTFGGIDLGDPEWKKPKEKVKKGKSSEGTDTDGDEGVDVSEVTEDGVSAEEDTGDMEDRKEVVTDGSPELFCSRTGKWVKHFKDLTLKYPDTILLILNPDDGYYRAYGQNCQDVIDVLGEDELRDQEKGINYCEMDPEELSDNCQVLVDEGYEVAIVKTDDKGEPVVEAWEGA